MRLSRQAKALWNIFSVYNLQSIPQVPELRQYDFILFDLVLIGICSPELLRRITAIPHHPPVFILTRETAWCFKKFAYEVGVCGYYILHRDMQVVINRIERFWDASPLICPSEKTQEPNNLKINLQNNEYTMQKRLLGQSFGMSHLRKEIIKICKGNEPVMIYGESGSGKNLVAKIIHDNSAFAAGPFVASNVSCIPVSLAESTLFGSVKGSFTGADDIPGLFEAANHGTLFLDEIGEMDISLQPKFLRVLEDKCVNRIGSLKSQKVDFRLVCATNTNLPVAVKKGLFRADLFYRLDVLRLEIPPLRTHPEDIPLLASVGLRSYKKRLSSDSLDKLHRYTWPGNVRQLFNCLARAARDTNSEIIYPDNIRF